MYILKAAVGVICIEQGNEVFVNYTRGVGQCRKLDILYQLNYFDIIITFYDCFQFIAQCKTAKFVLVTASFYVTP
jgi:hypothetical protein